jgi:glutamate dehydrogenase (NAD(P)+)
MAWMMDEYSRLIGHNAPGVITGKPIPLGGSQGRGDATARGGMYCIREAARALDIDLEGATVAIQGFGNAGQFAHKLVSELFGARVVAVSDSKGGIYNPAGLAYEAVAGHKRDTGSVVGYVNDAAAGAAGCQDITNTELLALGVDVLIPAALEGVIHAENAADVRARMVAELANGPTTPEADEVLFEKGVFVIPDFLCNAGGVTVSYFEQVQNAYGYYWDLDMVYQRLDQKMTAAFQAVHQVAQRYMVHNRLAAYVVAVARVAEACELRGWV